MLASHKMSIVSGGCIRYRDVSTLNVSSLVVVCLAWNKCDESSCLDKNVEEPWVWFVFNQKLAETRSIVALSEKVKNSKTNKSRRFF